MSSVINLSTRAALLGWLKDSSSCLNGQSDSLNEKVTIDHLLNSYSDVESLMSRKRSVENLLLVIKRLAYKSGVTRALNLRHTRPIFTLFPWSSLENTFWSKSSGKSIKDDARDTLDAITPQLYTSLDQTVCSCRYN